MVVSSNNFQQLPAGLSIVSSQPKKRVPRYPKHPFYVTQYPYELTPFFVAPVLAGETLNSLLLQARTVTTTLKNKLIGHHLEHYFFYVKLRDLADSADIVNMLINDGTSVNTAAGDSAYYNVKTGAVDWLKMCTDKVVEHYFRDQDDTGSHVGSVTGLPMVMWDNKKGIAESLIADAVIETDTITTSAPFGEHEAEWNTWTFMRQAQLTEMTFEDYLGTFGIRSKKEELSQPELIRFTKNWTYPTNTVDGSGNINTQASWSIQERADKQRFFKEPGFLVGYTVLRPKLYMLHQKQAAISLLNTNLAWLPATMKDQVYSSLRQFQANSAASPFTAAGTPSVGELDSDLKYWVDMRDIFVFGDQFSNVTLADTMNAVRAQDLTGFHNKKYPQSAALQNLGVSALTATSDGVVNLNIMGTQVDMS